MMGDCPPLLSICCNLDEGILRCESRTGGGGTGRPGNSVELRADPGVGGVDCSTGCGGCTGCDSCGAGGVDCSIGCGGCSTDCDGCGIGGGCTAGCGIGCGGCGAGRGNGGTGTGLGAGERAAFS